MIRPDKHDAALRTINRLLVYAQNMAMEKVAHEDHVGVLETAELIPLLLLGPDDETEFLRQMLIDDRGRLTNEDILATSEFVADRCGSSSRRCRSCGNEPGLGGSPSPQE